ncbi:helix-turn-helix domain-containing protein [Microbacterium kunmingense]|uniref:helix-turn-helix domain-containing protein n=1 Tax=Microbacterium kunmingense TaxID=2915939 RepID=UPI003D707CB1
MDTDDNYWKRVAAGVRAELARQRKPTLDLVPLLGLNRNAVYRRVRGEIPFDLAQIQTVADYLGVTVASFTESTAPREVA